MKKIFAILVSLLIMSLVFLLNSCDIQKEAVKSKSDTGFTENIESQTYRKGDTVHYEIPKVIYKDTTIYRTNRQGTTIKTVYDQGGNISSIDCFASAIAEFRKENREFQQSLKDKESKKTENFDSSFFIYIGAAIVILGIVALILFFIYVKKNTALVTQFIKSKND